MINDALIQTMLFFPFLLGPYFSYGLGGVADLAMEGIFVLAPIIMYQFISFGIIPAISISLFICILLGILTALMQIKGNVNSLLTGVLILYILQSLNLVILGRPYLSLSQSISTQTVLFSNIIIIILALIFVYSKIGLLSKLNIQKQSMLIQVCHNHFKIRSLIFILSNFFIASAGILTALSNGYIATQMGQGQMILAIGIVIFSLQIYKKNNFFQILILFLSNFFYFLLFNILIYLDINPVYLKIFVGIALAIFFVFEFSKRRIYE